MPADDTDAAHGQIAHWFTYHPPTPEQVDVYEELRGAAARFAHSIIELVPAGADRDHAVAAVREAVMWANAAVACEKPG